MCLGKSIFVNWSGSTDINWEEILLAQLFILFGSWSQGYILQWTWDRFPALPGSTKKQDKTMETVSSWKRNIHTASKTFLLVPFKQCDFEELA